MIDKLAVLFATLMFFSCLSLESIGCASLIKNTSCYRTERKCQDKCPEDYLEARGCLNQCYYDLEECLAKKD